MKKLIIPAAICAAIVGSVSVSAEFKYAQATADQNSVGDARSSEHLLGQIPRTTDPANQEAQFDKSKLLRCWQRGKLIVAENGWQLINQSSDTIMSKGKGRMTVYNFGDTFCMYLGEKQFAIQNRTTGEE